MIAALIIFLITYVLMLVFSRYRPWIALGSALLFIVTGMMPLGKVFGSIDFNVLLMIAGTMGTVALVIESGMPALLSDIILERVPDVRWAIVVLSLFSGVISAFVDNVATVLMIAPVALETAKRLDINPVKMIIAIAVSSNLQGAATLVGDTTAILLGSYAGMSFNDFFIYSRRPSMFFITELGAVLSALILLWLFRRERGKIQTEQRTKVDDPVPSWLLAATVILLIAASFIPNKPAVTNGLICTVLMLIGIIYNGIKKHSIKALWAPIKEIDYETILLLAGLFIVIGGITEQGVINELAALFTRLGGGKPFWVYTIIVWGSVIISAFIDNIPYVATMLPVTLGISRVMGISPTPLFFGLLVGATLGGNLTPIGASANITGIGILRREGYEVKNQDFLSIGIPFTLSAVIPAYILVWVLFGHLS